MLTAVGGSRWRQYANRLAHLEPVITGVILALVIAREVTESPLVKAVLVLLLLIYTVVIFASYNHSGLLCTVCAANFPLLPQAKAETGISLRAFTITHLMYDRPYVVTVFVLLFSAGWVSEVLAWLVWAWLGLYAWAAQRHRLLGPWCPLCRGHGGRGPREPSPQLPDLDPVGADPRTRTPS